MSSGERKDLERKIEALIIAIPREIESYDYYMEMHNTYDDDASKEMFLYLANQEKVHQNALEKLLGALESKLSKLTE